MKMSVSAVRLDASEVFQEFHYVMWGRVCTVRPVK